MLYKIVHVKPSLSLIVLHNQALKIKYVSNLW